MKLATWNMDFSMKRSSRDEAWDYLINTINPDIALVQDTNDIKNIPEGCYYDWQPTSRGYGSAIYSKFPGEEIAFETNFLNAYKGALLGAIVTLPNTEKMAVFSLYGLLEYKYGCRKGYATTSVHNMVSELTWIFNNEGQFGSLNKNIAIGGDFNVSVQCDIDNNSRIYRDAHKIVFERLNDFGLQSAFDWTGNNGFKRTHRHRGSKTPWQNDYIFLSQNLHGKMINPDIIEDNEVIELSDHNPVIAEFNI